LLKKSFIFPAVAFLIVMSGCVSQGTYDSKANEAETLATQNNTLHEQIKDLSAEVTALKKDQEMTRMENSALQAKVDELTRKADKAERLEKATQTYENLQKKLEKEIQQGKIQITEMQNRLTVTMVDKILFPSGSVEISPEGKKVLDKVVSILKDVNDKHIQVEGHTDNVPIRHLKNRYPTNWELSTARATEVVRYLQEDGIDPRVLSATGYSEYQPVAPNDSDEGRAKNRRIEIVLLPFLK
jgi:chemotaxis protein MotB